MKSPYLKYLVAIIGITLFAFFLSFNKVSAQETTTKVLDTITVYTSDDCEFCKALEDELKKTYSDVKYTLKNIDSSDEILKEYQIAIVTCGKEKGTVPMYSFDNTCVSGKEQILETFKSKKDASDLTSGVNAESTISTVITETLTDITNQSPIDALAWYDYVITVVLLLLVVAGLVMTIRVRKSVNKSSKLIAASVFVIGMIGMSVFIYLKIVDVNNLGSSGADAAGKNCLTTNTCKDWNEFVKAKEQNATNKDDKDMWASRVVDQKVLDAQIAAQNTALLKQLAADPQKYCGEATCNFGKFISNQKTLADNQAAALPACADPKSVECTKAKANKYLDNMYGYSGGDRVAGKPLEGELGKAINDYTQAQLELAYKGLIDNASKLEGSRVDQEAVKACIASGKSSLECQKIPLKELLTTYKKYLTDNKIYFNKVNVDQYSQMGIWVPTQVVNETVNSDECLVPTAGGACPVGTATCICQEETAKLPFRATCAAIGQTCYNTCMATHNVCTDCTDKDREPVELVSSCQQACSANSPCTDGTTCSGGKCVNLSCPNDADCMCNSTTPICGDGLINNSDQAPEQCELGDPAGTSCSWNSCNQNTCKCPDTNPNWDIEKTSSVVCVNDNTANAYASVKFNISATYINESSPSTVGVLERVVDEPEGYMTSWLDTDSINEGGVATSDGNYVDKITWDLSGAVSQFTIPSGQTEVTKSDFLTYTFNVPKEFFGRYVNLVTGYPNQDNDENSFNNNHSVYIGCNVPGTALFDSTSSKVILGIVLVAIGLLFAYSTSTNGIAFKIVNTDGYSKLSIMFANKEEKNRLKREQFEKKILKK